MPYRLRKRSNLAFAACALALIAIKLLFDFYLGDFPVRGQAEAFTWPVVVGILLIGFLGLLAERSIGLPDAFADSGRGKRGIWLAVATGLAYAAITVAQDLFIAGGGNLLNLEDWAHVAWPWSLPFYTFGAIFLEFLLRLGALCILVWFFHVLVFRRRAFPAVFWAMNLIVAFYEIMPMTLAEIDQGDWAAVALTPLQPLYLSNVFEGWLLLRYGWFAPIVFRLAFYLLWHIVYGGLGPF